ncbi:hypothetical protein [Campylobacter fetus]|nr:hypothetical protein [Campylobacter fetus]QYA61106.1 S-layer protein [Campylobacter fetus subsp. fetus]
MISKSEVSELFIVLFGRPTEGEGNTYWVNESSANGWGMIETSNAILNLDITKSFLGETLNNNESFVKHLFKNAVNLTEFVSDEQKAGLKYWVDLLDNGTVSKADLVGHFVNAAKDPSNAGANQDLFNNKVIVSNYVADTIAKLPLDGLTPDQQNALIQKTVDIINNVTSNSSSVESAKGEVDALKSELPNPGSTYDLTEGNDNLKGTDLDDTFNGTTYVGNGTNKSTLSAFDKIDGGAGRDTLNAQVLANNSASDAKLKSEDLVKALAGVTNVEKLNIISEVKAADGGGLTINGYKSVSLNIVGETKIADTDATKLDIKASGNVTVTKAEAVKDLSINAANSEVSIAANATKALENLTIKNASKLTATNAFDGDTLKSVTLSNVTLGDTNAAAAFDFKGVSTLNFDNVVSAQTADSKIAHITSSAETLNLNLSGKTATVALATNSVTKVANINANADVNAFLITKANGEMNPGHADLQNDSFTTFIVKGNGKELTLNAGDLDLVKDIDTTGFSGNAKVSFGDTDSVDGSQLSVKTGAGNDTLNLEAKKLKAGSLIDGGEGNDTIIMKASALADAATLGMIKNIENVTVSDALSANTDVSASSFVNIGLLADNTGGGNDVVLTINKDQIVDIQTAKLAENKKVTIKLNDATGADDTVNIVLNAKAIIGADKSVTVGANDAAKALIINKDIETVNITSVTKDSTTDNKLYMKVAEGAEGANKVIITGDAATTLAAGGVAASDLKTIKDLDASALTGKLTFDASVNKLASGATIKGGSGDDSITVGYDTQVVTLGAGDDTVVLKAGNADIAKYSTITDFSKGDKIDISQLKANTKNAATSISKADELASTATFKEQVEAILKSDGSNTAVAKYFQFGGDTYIVVDTANAATSTITADTDGIIKLAGFTGDLTIDGSSIITVA